MDEQKIKDALIASGCEVYTYEGQDGTFLRKKFPLKTICEKLNLNVSEVEYTMDSLEEDATEDEYVVEFIVATGELQYYINQYHWERVGIDSKVGANLLPLLMGDSK